MLTSKAIHHKFEKWNTSGTRYSKDLTKNYPLNLGLGQSEMEVYEQKITEQDWLQFRKILNGSYYWNFPSVMKDNRGTDGETLALESRCVLPIELSADTMSYYSTTTRATMPGSYTDACSYLMKISVVGRQLPKDALEAYFHWYR